MFIFKWSYSLSYIIMPADLPDADGLMIIKNLFEPYIISSCNAYRLYIHHR